MFRVILKTATCVAALVCSSVSANAVEVYMFKGAGDFSFVNENMHFSRGLDEMSKTLNAEGIRSEVRRFGAIEDALKTIRERKPKSIALVGHSMGALASMAMARNLKGEGIDIVYMALLDIPGPVGVAGDNVEWVENYYTINPVYGKLTNVRSHPNAKNINILGYIHNRLDDAPKVQKGILSAIRKVNAEEQQNLLPEPIQPSQPETLHVEANPVPAPDPQVTASVPPQPQTQPQPQAINVQPVHTSAATDRPLQPLASGDPYALPSVRPLAPVTQQALTGETSQSLQSSYVQPIEQPVNSSVPENAGILQQGRNLMKKAGSFLRSSSTSNRRNSLSFDGDR